MALAITATTLGVSPAQAAEPDPLAPIQISGSVVDGITGQPLPPAVAIRYRGSGDGSLPRVFNHIFWDRVWTLEPGQTVAGDTASDVTRNRLSDPALTRVTTQSRFTLTDSAENEAWGVLLLAPGHLPHLHALPVPRREAKKAGQRDLDLGVTPLFPAGVVRVRLKFPPQEGKWAHTAHPRWSTDRDMHPFDGQYAIPATDNAITGDCYVAGHLEAEIEHEVYLPAGVPLTFFVEPSDQHYALDRLPFQLELARGETRDLGNLFYTKLPTLPVRVVDETGEEIFGISIRCFDHWKRAWEVPHRNGIGRVEVPVDPRTGFRLRIDGLPWKDSPIIESPPFEDIAEVDPPVFVLTAEQVEFLREQQIESDHRPDPWRDD